jgi:hypothetical protein
MYQERQCFLFNLINKNIYTFCKNEELFLIGFGEYYETNQSFEKNKVNRES